MCFDRWNFRAESYERVTSTTTADKLRKYPALAIPRTEKARPPTVLSSSTAKN